MSSIPLTAEQRAQRWGRIAKYAALPVAGLLFYPIAKATLLGTAALIAVAAVLVITWMLLPVIQSAAANLRLRLIKAEAAKNPIESLQSEYLRRQLLLQERSTKIETLDAKTRGFGAKLAGFKSRYPAEAPMYQEVYDKMTLLLKRSREQWKQAEQGLDAFDSEIEKAKAKWEMARSASALQKDAGMVEAEFIAKLKVETSLDAIQDGMNMAFAQLDTLLMESDNVEVNVTNTAPQAALPAADSHAALDMAVVAPAKSKVLR